MPDRKSFPKFPVAFTEKDLERKEQLKERKKELEQIYFSHYVSPGTWEKKPLLERTARTVAAEIYSPPKWLRDITPWRETGFTPRQFDVYRGDVEAEYQELERKQLVSDRLSKIVDHLTVLAQESKLSGSKEQLYEYIPELGHPEQLPLTNVERDFVEEYALFLAGATEEELEKLGEGIELTPEEMRENIKLISPSLSPLQVMSTIAFEKNQGEIQRALQMSFPPQVADLEGASKSKKTEDILEEMKERGLVPSGDLGEDIKALEQSYQEEDKRRGELAHFRDQETGELCTGFIESDGAVWIDGELEGHLDKETNEVIPADYAGNPLRTEEDEAFFFRKWYNWTLFGIKQSWASVGTARTALGIELSRFGAPPEQLEMPTEEQWSNPEELRKVLPPDIYRLWQSYSKAVPHEEAVALTLGRINYYNEKIAETNRTLLLKHDEKEAELEQWFEKHPAARPKPSYADPENNPHVLWDYNFWAYAFLSMFPAVATTLAVGSTVTVATRNPLLGAVAMGISYTPLEMGSLQRELVEAGASPTQASALSVPVGTAIGLVEILPSLIFMKMLMPAFSRMFKKGLQGALVEAVVKKMTLKSIATGAAKRVLIFEAVETTEEVVQEAMSNAAIRIIDENKGLFEGLGNTAITSAVAFFPMAIFGGGGYYWGMKGNLPEATQEQMNETVEEMENRGLSPEHAEAVALGQVLDTVEGQAQVKEAMEKTKKSIPDKENKASRLVDAELDLRQANKDLEIFQGSLEAQERRLASMTLPHERAEQMESIESLKNQITSSEKTRDEATKYIEALKEPTTPITAVPFEYIAKESWRVMSIPARVTLAKAAGLQAKAGRKAWTTLTEEERTALSKQAKIVEESVLKEPSEAAPVISEESVASINKLIEAKEEKWSAAKKRNSKLAAKDLDELESKGVDVSEARDSLEEYNSLARADFENAEEFSEERTDAWDDFINDLGAIEELEEVTPEIVEEAIPDQEELQAIEEERTYAIDDTKATEQAKNMEGFSEQIIDPNELNTMDIREVEANVDTRLFEPDESNPLDVAASIAMHTGDIGDYAEALPSDFNANVSEGFKKANFADVGYWKLMIMDTIRAFAFIDLGYFGGLARRKVLRPTERLALAQIRKKEHYVSWFVNNAENFQMNTLKYRLMFRGKKGHEVIARMLESIKNFGEAVKPVDEILARENVQEVIGKYPREVQENLVGFAQKLRIIMDAIWTDTNVVRVKLGKKPIPYLDNYLPWVYEANVWAKCFGLDVKPDFLKETAPPPDYLKPSEPTNFRAMEREGGLKNYHKIRDVRRLFVDYADIMTQDMFFTPIIQNAKAHARVMKEKAPAAADWITDWVTESYAGVPGVTSRALKRILPPPLRSTMLLIRRNITRAVFPLNWTWNLIVQPSSMALTSLQYGAKNTVLGLQYLWNPEAQRYVHDNLYSFIIKQRLEGSVLYQDLGATVQRQHAMTRSKLDTAVHYANFLTRLLEQKLTGVSCYAAYLRGKELGYTGEKLIDYASEGGAKTQSMYNMQNVPGILRSKEVGAIVPFQTFAFEALNAISEMANIKYYRAGAYHTVGIDTKTGQELLRVRMMRFAEFLATAWVFNIVGQLAINRKPWQISSALPFSSLMMSGIQPFRMWNLPLPFRFSAEFWNGVMAYYHTGNWRPITSWATSYWLVGGIQADRTMQGIEAVIEGKVYDVTREKVLYEIEDDPIEWIKAIMMGAYRTEAGERWAEKQFEEAEPTANEYLKEMTELEEQLGMEVEGRTYLLPKYASDIEQLLTRWEIKRGNLIEEESMEWSGLPETLILDEASPFPDKAKFYTYCKKLWGEYEELPSDQKLQYRISNPAIDASLFFWYKTSTVRTKKAQNHVLELFRLYGVDERPYMHPANLPEIPEELKLIPE